MKVDAGGQAEETSDRGAAECGGVAQPAGGKSKSSKTTLASKELIIKVVDLVEASIHSLIALNCAP